MSKVEVKSGCGSVQVDTTVTPAKFTVVLTTPRPGSGDSSSLGFTYSAPLPSVEFQIAGEKIIRNAVLSELSDLKVSTSINPDSGSEEILVQGCYSLLLQIEFKIELPKDPQRFPSWKTRVTNLTSASIQMQHIVLSAGRLEHPPVQAKKSAAAVTVSGWQSWSYAGTPEFKRGTPTAWYDWFNGPSNESQSIPTTSRHYAKLNSDLYAGVSGTTSDSKSQAWWTVVPAFLSQKEQLGMITFPTQGLDSLQVFFHCPCDNVELRAGQSIVTDPATLIVTTSSSCYYGAFSKYFSLLGSLHSARQKRIHDEKEESKSLSPVGWCSWYYFYENISEKTLLDNATALGNLRPQFPVSVIQLDDGFQEHVGDWIANKKFPGGLDTLSERVEDVCKGSKAGIWLAPVLSQSIADTAKLNPSWIIKKPGKTFFGSETLEPSHAGINWGGKPPLGLDITNAEVEKFVTDLIKKYRFENKFTYLKLDFLFGTALQAIRKDPTFTRAQAMVKALKVIRAAAGDDTYIVGCGCPLGTAIGYVDAMRISADVAPNFYPELPLSVLNYVVSGFKNDPHFPSMRNAVRNIITRMEMHGRLWTNDPDCLLVRSTNTKLTLTEVQSLATVVGFSAGMFLLSDDVPKLDQSRLEIATNLYPIVPDHALVGRQFEQEIPEHLLLPFQSWAAFARFNWSDRPSYIDLQDLFDLTLKNGEKFTESKEESVLHLFEFWSQTYSSLKVNSDSKKIEMLSLSTLSERPATFDLIERADSKLSLKGKNSVLKIEPHGCRLFIVRSTPFRYENFASSIVYVGSNLHFSGGFELVNLSSDASKKTVKAKFSVGRNASNILFHFYIGESPEYTSSSKLEAHLLKHEEVLQVLTTSYKDDSRILTVAVDKFPGFEFDPIIRIQLV